MLWVVPAQCALSGRLSGRTQADCIAFANNIFKQQGFNHLLVYDKELEAYAAQTQCGTSFLSMGLIELGHGGSYSSVNLRKDQTRIACAKKDCGGLQFACAVDGPRQGNTAGLSAPRNPAPATISTIDNSEEVEESDEELQKPPKWSQNGFPFRNSEAGTVYWVNTSRAAARTTVFLVGILVFIGI